MTAFQGFFEAGRFISDNTDVIPEHKRAIVTILDDETPKPGAVNEKIHALEECFKLIDASDEEVLPEEFPRLKLRQEIHV
jgi:hypothetical protein